MQFISGGPSAHPSLYRPDITFAVDWALNNNYLSIYLSVSLIPLVAVSSHDHALSRVDGTQLYCLTSPRREAGGFLMSPRSLESQGDQFDPTFLYIYILYPLVLLPSPVALSVLSFSAFGPFS